MTMSRLEVIYRRCDSCPHEFEIEWDHVTTPVANGHEPEEHDNYGWIWRGYHGPNDCDSSLIIFRSDFDDPVDPNTLPLYNEGEGMSEE